MFKYDLHVHTSEVSPCGMVSAADAVRLYKDAGYSGVCITDHFRKEFFDNIAGTAREKADAFLSGYREAKRFGEQIGLTVMLGMEIKLEGSCCNEYLVYGLNEDFLYENFEMYKMDFFSFGKYINDAGLLMYQAHPLRPGAVIADRSFLFGIEGYNGNQRHNSRNHEALKWAASHSIPTISGSDFHQTEDVARGGIITDEVVFSSHMLLSTLRNNKYRLLCV